MTIERALVGTTDAVSGPATYVEDVFSTYLYNGTSASQTINNGIDLATKGGMVWLKPRNQPYYNNLYDTSRGVNNFLVSDTTDPAYTQASADLVTAFNTNGFTLGADANQWFANKSAVTYASWTFRKQAKFFDIVTYTGTGSARTISHNLGATPGMIIVKRTDDLYNWQVYHNGLTSAAYSLRLNLTNGQASATTVWDSTAPTSSVFSVGTDVTVNASGGTYVAYLFAASNSGGFGPAGTDSVVACGSFTTDGSQKASVTLGWEPQFVIVKCSSTTSSWIMLDNMRGWDNGASDKALLANSSNAEADFGQVGEPTATGFNVAGLTASSTFIYLAIRRPMKTPTDATKVYHPDTVSDANITVGFPADMFFGIYRDGGTANSPYVGQRLTGNNKLVTSSTDAEVSGVYNNAIFQDNTQLKIGYLGATSTHAFKRAPGFFDVVCWTGSGSVGTVSHNLGVTPELVIYKTRSTSQIWGVYNPVGITGTLVLSSSSAANSGNSTSWFNGLAPTASVLNVGTTWNGSSTQYIAYLFATCPGVSKVGSYTGTGAAQNIDCGFASGARFVLIKTTNTVGNWWVFDTARGINSSANDPVLYLNASAAEVTYLDFISPYSGGFALTSGSAANNSGDSYIYLAIA